MTQKDQIEQFLAPLSALQRLLVRFGDQGMVIGGVAASLLGAPRLTADVDAVILLSVEELPRLIKAAEKEGFGLRMADGDEFARRHRVLLLRHQESGINLDLSLGMLPFEEEAIQRSISYRLGGLTVRLPTPEDLIIFKAVAHRPKDLQDIQAIIERAQDLDRMRIEKWVQEFARALDMPELWDDIASWL